MKFIVSFILIMLLSFASSLFFPWWMIAIAAFVVSVAIPQRPFTAFICGFLALFLLWGVQSFLIDYNNDHVLANKVAALLPLGGYYLAIILVTAIVGGLLAGMGALTGSFLRTKKVVRARRDGFETRKIVIESEHV